MYTNTNTTARRVIRLVFAERNHQPTVQVGHTDTALQ